MFGPEWFNDAWKIYAKYMQRPGQLKAKGLLWPGNGFALWHGTHHPTSPCQELAMQPHVGLFKKGNTWNPAKLGKQWRLGYQELQDVVQNFPSQTNSMMSGTTTDGATCNKMENLVRIWYIRATGTNLVLSKHASHWHRIEMIFKTRVAGCLIRTLKYWVAETKSTCPSGTAPGSWKYRNIAMQWKVTKWIAVVAATIEVHA